jgi:hypothetical protein
MTFADGAVEARAGTAKRAARNVEDGTATGSIAGPGTCVMATTTAPDAAHPNRGRMPPKDGDVDLDRPGRVAAGLILVATVPDAAPPSRGRMQAKVGGVDLDRRGRAAVGPISAAKVAARAGDHVVFAEARAVVRRADFKAAAAVVPAVRDLVRPGLGRAWRIAAVMAAGLKESGGAAADAVKVADLRWDAAGLADRVAVVRK